MTKLPVFTSKGTKSGDLEFPKEMLLKENAGLMAQAFYVFENRSHKRTSKVKTRADVSLSTRKIYRQKGTGGARHGDKKAPIFVGGGVAHGPKGNKRVLSISGSLNKAALKMFWSLKLKNKSVCFIGIDAINKTKDASNLLKAVTKGMDKPLLKNTLVLLSKDKKEKFKFFRNLNSVNVNYWENLNLRELYLSRLVMVDKDVLNEKSKETVKKEDLKVKKVSKVKKTK